MKLTTPTLEDVAYVTNRLVGGGREIFALRFHDDPDRVAEEAMATAYLSWVAWHGGRPAAVFGAAEITPGVWAIRCFGTDDMPKLIVPITRFFIKTLLPLLFDDFGAHRLELDALAEHTHIHRWVETFGARREGVKEKRGKGGEDYVAYVLVKGVDWPFDKRDSAC